VAQVKRDEIRLGMMMTYTDHDVNAFGSICFNFESLLNSTASSDVHDWKQFAPMISTLWGTSNRRIAEPRNAPSMRPSFDPGSNLTVAKSGKAMDVRSSNAILAGMQISRTDVPAINSNDKSDNWQLGSNISPSKLLAPSKHFGPMDVTSDTMVISLNLDDANA
jgi:hypothetical protein